MTDRPPTPIRQIREAAFIGAAAGLEFVYAGNAAGEGQENTLCPACGMMLIERRGFLVRSNTVRGNACPGCGCAIPGVDLDPQSAKGR